MKKYIVKFKTKVTKIGHIKICAWNQPGMNNFYVQIYNTVQNKLITEAFECISPLGVMMDGKRVLFVTPEELKLINNFCKNVCIQ